jgi:Ca-activated chloride channel homolog
LVLALSFPRFGYQEIKREVNGRDLFIVMDFSLSMWAQDVSPSRMERARREVIDLTELLTGDRVGVIGFAEQAQARMPLTTDYKLLQKVLRETSPDNFRSQGSNIGAGIKLALDILSRKNSKSTKNKSILLISDGENHQQDIDEISKRARRMGVRIYSLAVGEENGSPIPLPSGGFVQNSHDEIVMTKRENTSLAILSKQTEGAMAISVSGDSDIKGLYLDGIRRLSHEGSRGAPDKIWNELFQWALFVSFVGLLFAFWPGILIKQVLALVVMVVILPVDAGEVFEESTENLEQVAIELLKDGKAGQAHYILEEALQSLDDSEDRLRIGYNAGVAAYQAGKLARALQHWETVLLQNPNHKLSLKNIESIQQELQHRHALMEENPEPSGQKKNMQDPSKEHYSEKLIVDKKSDSDLPILMTSREARRLFESVAEGKIRGDYSGQGTGEKGW